MGTVVPHILLVDDEPDLRDLLRMFLLLELHPGGVRITEAQTGEDALTACTHDHVDVIVLDLHLRRRITGFDVLRGLRRQPADHPFVVAWSADSAALAQAAALGADRTVEKGTDMVVLSEAIRGCLAAAN